jgi:CBS domain containing-hemolysin-like protein
MGLSPTTQNLLTWLGIALCIAQSGMFAGLNLAIFSLSRLRLEIAANAGDADAVKVRELRRDSNLTLTTIVWGSVATNVLLTLLSDLGAERPRRLRILDRGDHLPRRDRAAGLFLTGRNG